MVTAPTRSPRMRTIRPSRSLRSPIVQLQKAQEEQAPAAPEDSIVATLLPLVDPDDFWSRVDRSAGPNACWTWMGTMNESRSNAQYSPYFRQYRRSFTMRAHRVAYYLTYKKLAPHLAHTCQNAYCVNPAHLVPAGNRQRALLWPEARPTGERHPNAKLTEEQVREIRRLAVMMTQKDLAARFNVSQNTISRILLRNAWKDVR